MSLVRRPAACLLPLLWAASAGAQPAPNTPATATRPATPPARPVPPGTAPMGSLAQAGGTIQAITGGGQPAHRGRHHPLLHAGAARRSVRSRPARSQPQDPLRHRPVPGCPPRPQRQHAGRARGGKPAGQPGRLRGQPQAERRPAPPRSAAQAARGVHPGAGRGRPAQDPRRSMPSTATTTPASRHRSSACRRTASTWSIRSTTAPRR